MMSRLMPTASYALGLCVLGLAFPTAPRSAGAGAQASTVRAESFGVAVSSPSVNQTAPRAALAAGAPMASDQAPTVTVPGFAAAENLFAVATGADHLASTGTPAISAESHATLETVNLLNGLITADGVVAVASSAIGATTVNSDAEGSQLANVVVNGVAAAAEPAPNTRMDIPGVGYVVLNEQIPSGDGVTSTGITVNMIHVYLQSVGLLGTVATTGEIIAGSATSFVSR